MPIPLTAFILSDEVYDILFYIIKIAVSLYSLYYVYYTRVAVLLGIIMSLDTVPYLFFRYIKFFSGYWELFLRVFQDTRDCIEFLGV